MEQPVQRVVSPISGLEREEVPLWETPEVEAAIGLADESHGRLRGTSFAERAEWMLGVANELDGRKESLALLMAEEMGKPVREGRSEVEKCAWVCRYYAEEAEGFLAGECVELDEGKEGRVEYVPMGIVLAVMPWNFPFWQVFRFAAPALMAGNTGLLKHAGNVQGCARTIEEIVAGSGFGPGCLINLPVEHEEVERIIADGRVRAVTLTGSSVAGREVGACAGRHLKKCVMELGGSDPYLVLEDADLEVAVKACVTSRLINAGQSCIAAKRFLVHEAVHEEFLVRMEQQFRAQVVGDPRSEETTIGPLARFDLREELVRQVDQSIEAGARCLMGGQVPREGSLGEGAFYPPTILDGVLPGMAAFDEELFGPVAAVVRVGSEEEAIALANRSEYGLGGAVFTRNVDRGARLAREELLVGSVAVNGFVASDPRMPFGGVKASGYGRELGRFGIREFVNIKSLTVPAGEEAIRPPGTD